MNNVDGTIFLLHGGQIRLGELNKKIRKFSQGAEGGYISFFVNKLGWGWALAEISAKSVSFLKAIYTRKKLNLKLEF